MNEQKFLEWKKQTSCSGETEKMVQRIFDAGPTRKVQSKVGNVITMSHSNLMNVRFLPRVELLNIRMR